MKRFLLFLSCIFIFTQTGFSHKNFWEIKTTVLPEGESLSFNIFCSLEQINELLPEEDRIKEYIPANKKELREKLLKICPDIVELTEENKKLSPHIKIFDIFVPDELSDEKTLPMDVVDVEIGMVFFTSGKKIQVEWNLFADSVIEKKTKDLKKLPKEAYEVIVFFLDDKLSKYLVTKNNNQFSWDPFIQPEEISLNAKPAAAQNLKKAFPSYISVLLLALALAVWAFTRTKAGTAISIVLLLSTIPLFTMTKQSSNTTYTLPDKENIGTFMEKALNKFYISAITGNKDLKWNSINNFTSDRLREKVFLRSFDNLSKPLKHFVESVKVNEVKVLSDKQLVCNWDANAVFQHNTHIHEKKLKFQGIFTFEVNSTSCLIDDVNIRQIIEAQ